MHTLFGISLILYLLKLLASQEFWTKFKPRRIIRRNYKQYNIASFKSDVRKYYGFQIIVNLQTLMRHGVTGKQNFYLLQINMHH